jgi:DNA polymerase I
VNAVAHNQQKDGGPMAPVSFCPSVPFREAWFVDFEFRADPGERPWPICMVAREMRSDREIRLWRDELLALRLAPFDTGSNSILVAYSASAELGCFLELGWPLPINVLDLLVEHRVETNGLILPGSGSLLDALALRGVAHIDAGHKEAMRKLAMENWSWTDEERRALLEYCATDVAGLTALLPKMARSIDWPRAILRGRYTAAVARMERAGIPIDLPIFRRLTENWDSIIVDLVAKVDEEFGAYEGSTFKEARFAAMLGARGIAWPRWPTGRLKLDDDTFGDQTKLHPELRPLRELRATLGKMRLTGLPVGADGRNRCPLWGFSSKTGRNQPSNSKFIFGPAKWMRGLIRPPEGYGLAYIDFAAQEIAIAAGLSGDERMIEAYRTGDPYLAFAKQAGLVPEEATKESHNLIRERCKSVVLGVNYGMGADSMAARAGIMPVEASDLLRLHRQTYWQFWRWSDDVVDAAMLTNEIKTVFGWRRRVGPDPNPRSLMNFPMQANGAEMMRVAAIAAVEAGIEVCAPVHDAFLIAAPLDQLDEDVARMREIMTRAGAIVTGGVEVRTDAQVRRWPDRYMDERGEAMWDKVMALLDQTQGAST